MPTVGRPSSSLTYHLLSRRGFSWGARHKHNHPHAGKISKGFSTQDACKGMARRQLYRGISWNSQYPLRYLPRYLRIQEWRFSSSWGPPDAKPKNRPEEKSEDWFSRWQRRREERYSEFAKSLEYKEKQYTEFMQVVEDDPYGALFGRHWMKAGQAQNTRDFESSPQQARTLSGNSTIPRAEKPVAGNSSSGQINMADKQSRPKAAIAESRRQEYEIDPITMRKVPKKSSSSMSPMTSTTVPNPNSTTVNVEIPIKRFRPSTTEAPSTQHSSGDIIRSNSTSAASSFGTTKSQDAGSWLAQEGFGRRQNTKVEDRPVLRPEDVTSRSMASKVESALDRHLKGRSTTGNVSERSSLQYQPEENTTEDNDSLRSSDVRESAGLRGKFGEETVSTKQARRRKLEEEYDQRPVDRESELAQEVSTDTPKRTSGDRGNTLTSSLWTNEISDGEGISPTQNFADQQTHIESDPVHQSNGISKYSSKMPQPADARANQLKAQSVSVKVRLDLMKAEYDTLRTRWLEENRKLKAVKKANEMHEEEVKYQKQAMQAMEMRGVRERVTVGDKKPSLRPLQSLLQGEGDLAMNVVEFAERDRWYKQKAPHAKDNNEAQLKKLAKDRELIREVRSIYEDTYGVIDTKHRQPCQSEHGSKGQQIIGEERPDRADIRVQSSTEPPSSNPQGKNSLNSNFSHKVQSQNADIARSSEPSATIQWLLDELRQAQDIAHQHRIALRLKDETDDFRTVADTKLSVSKPYLQIVLEIAKSALYLSTTAVADFTAPNASQTPSPSAIKVSNAETQTSKTPSVYRILAYDPATQKVVSSSETMSLTPLSKEQHLMPAEALEALQNPGKFLPQLMILHNKGYNIVSGTRNVIVFKKEATGDELEIAEHVEANKYPNPIDGTIASTGNFASPTGFVNHDSPIPLEELEHHRANSAANSSKGTQKPSLNTSSSSNKVRREEAVFSGRRGGGWQETKHKHPKTETKRGRMFTSGCVLLTGTLTVCICYQIGVLSVAMNH